MSCSSELYSHPGKLLEDHLIGVKELALQFLSEKPREWQERLKPYLTIACLTHDIAKATSYFQEYLLTDEEARRRELRNKPETKHSHLSAIVAYYLAKEIAPEGSLMPFFTYVAVRRHHGDLKDVYREASLILDESEKTIIKSQIESIDADKFRILGEKLHEVGLPRVITLEDLKGAMEVASQDQQLWRRFIRRQRRQWTVAQYFIMNLLYSLLLDADKTEVVIGKHLPDRPDVPVNLVDTYKQKVFGTGSPTSPLNKLREQAYEEALRRAEELSPDNRILTLNLPTGMGKTLTALSVALHLREKLGGTHRIIYSLPFLSIIDQTSSIVEDIFRKNGIEPTTSLLLKHHHLSEIYYRDAENEFEEDHARLLIEGWNSEIIITTFVQLFHTLISYRNRAMRKLHRLARSIIILDEVQSIPVKYWEPFREVLEFLTRQLDAYVLFVTATQPLIVEPEAATSLVEHRKYFSQLKRISLVARPEVSDFEQLYNHIFEEHARSGKSVLCILNTINSAKEFYDSLTARRHEQVAYLSSHLVPAHRLQVIREIKQGKYPYAVTTQLVEAGVDIDFNVVVRDLAPLDSVIQSAGRCNRNALHQGVTYVVQLLNPNHHHRPWASYIYDATLLDITKQLLFNGGQNKWDEDEVYELIHRYFELVKDRKAQDIQLLEAIRQLRYQADDGTSIRDFQLIEEAQPQLDVFIEWDEHAQTVWQEYEQIVALPDPFERRKQFDRIRARFYQYVVAIPSRADNLPPQMHGFGYVSRDDLEHYYDPITGYKLNTSGGLFV